MKVGASLLSVIALALIVDGASASAVQQPPISGLGQDVLSVKAKTGDDEATTHVSVLNAGRRPAEIDAVAFQAASSDKIRVAGFTPRTVPPGATRLAVTLRGLSNLKTERAEGQLVVTSGGVPVARAVTITPAPQPTREWPELIFWGAVGVFGLVLALGLFCGALTGTLLNAAPGAKWSFSSWATTLTAAGGVLGTILGAATLPEIPREIDKDTFVRLNLVFGALVVVGPFIFQSLRNLTVRASEQESGYDGFNLTLLIACAITGGAVFGELATLALLGWELTGGDVWGEAIAWGVGVLGVLAGWYCATTAIDLVTTDWEAEAKDAKDKARKQLYSITLTTQHSDNEAIQRFELVLEKQEPATAGEAATGKSAAGGRVRVKGRWPRNSPGPERAQPLTSWKLP